MAPSCVESAIVPSMMHALDMLGAQCEWVPVDRQELLGHRKQIRPILRLAVCSGGWFTIGSVGLLVCWSVLVDTPPGVRMVRDVETAHGTWHGLDVVGVAMGRSPPSLKLRRTT